MHVGPDLFSTCMYSWNQQVLSEGHNSLDQMVHVYILLAQPVSNIKSEAWVIFRLLVVTKLLCCVHSLVTSRRDGSTSDHNRGFDTTRGVDLKSSDCLHIFPWFCAATGCAIISLSYANELRADTYRRGHWGSFHRVLYVYILGTFYLVLFGLPAGMRHGR